MSPETIEEHLRRYGWVFHRQGVSSTWRTGFYGSNRVFPMEIGLTETFLSFEVFPLLEGEVCWTDWPELLTELMELNARIRMARLGLTPRGISLSLEIPAAGLTYEGLETTLSVFAFNVEQCYDVLLHRVRELGCYRDRQPLL